MGHDLGLPMLPPFDLYHVCCGISCGQYLLERVQSREQHREEAHALTIDTCVLATHHLAHLYPLILGPD